MLDVQPSTLSDILQGVIGRAHQRHKIRGHQTTGIPHAEERKYTTMNF